MTKQELLNHLIDSGEYQKDYYMCNALHFSKAGTKELRKELQQEIAELIYPYGTLVVALWHKNPYVCELLNTDPLPDSQEAVSALYHLYLPQLGQAAPTY